MHLKNYLLLCGGALLLSAPAMARNPHRTQLPKPPGMTDRMYAVVNAKYQAYERAALGSANTAAKTTAIPQRVIGQAYYEWGSASPMFVDSAAIRYGGSRGSKFGEYILYYGMQNLTDQPGEVEYRDTYVQYDTLQTFDQGGSTGRGWRSYNSAGKVVLSEQQAQQRKVFGYLSNGNLSSVVTIADQGSGLDSVQRDFYIYNASGFVVKDSVEGYDSTTMTWRPGATFLFNYNGAGQMISFQVDFSLGGMLLTFQRNDYTYGSNGRVSRILNQMMDFTTFNLEEQYKDSLGYSGNTMIYEDFSVPDPSTGVYAMNYQERRHLNARGLPDSVSQISLQGGTSGYLKLAYDANDYPTRVTFWQFGGVTPDNEFRYYYQLVPNTVPKVQAMKVLQLAPNPASATIRLDNKLGAHFRIFDLGGRLMMDGTVGAAASIDVAALAPGLYSIVLSDQAGEQFSGRFVKR